MLLFLCYLLEGFWLYIVPCCSRSSWFISPDKLEDMARLAAEISFGINAFACVWWRLGRELQIRAEYTLLWFMYMDVCLGA